MKKHRKAQTIPISPTESPLLSKTKAAVIKNLYPTLIIESLRSIELHGRVDSKLFEEYNYCWIIKNMIYKVRVTEEKRTRIL
jgi:hypothetical protein